MYIFFMFLAIIAALFVLLGYIIFAVAIRRPKRPKPPKDELRIQRAEIRRQNNQKLYDLSPEDVTIQTPDGLALRGWLLPAAKPTRRIVVCVHGHGCNGPDEFSHMMPFYHETLGYHYFLPDLRGHGRSDGKYMCFGALDHKDLLQWLDFLIARFGQDCEILLHGISMGAATVMLTNCANPPEQVKLVVEDCGYTSCHAVIHNTVLSLLHFPCPPVIYIASLFTRLFAGYWFHQADCLKRLRNAKNPMLFIHGAADTYVPTTMGIKLHEVCPVPKELLLVEGAVHAYSYYDAKELYEQSICAFIEKQWKNNK